MTKLPIGLLKLKPPIAKELFNQATNNCNLRHIPDLPYAMSEAISHCTSIISFLGPKIKDTVPAEFEELTSLIYSGKQLKISIWKLSFPTKQDTSRLSGFSIIYYLLGYVFFPTTDFTALFY